MTRIRRVAVFATICLVVPVVWVSPAFAARTLTLESSTDLVDHQFVPIDGAGFTGSAEVLICQTLDGLSQGADDCGGELPRRFTIEPTGDFSNVVLVKRLISIPSLGRTVNCAIESCAFRAAETDDIPGTATFAPFTLAPGQPDGLIKRRSDGQITGDNVYSTGAGQQRRHAIEPGGKWVFALRVENDGLETDDITVHTAGGPSYPCCTVRAFIGYYDVTASVFGDTGFTYPDMAPGEIRPLALQITARPDVLTGGFDLPVRFRSDTDLSDDWLIVGVRVRPAT